MANLPSSSKRSRQNVKRREANRARKASLKTSTRKYRDALHGTDLGAAGELLVGLNRQIDIITAKGTLHRNTAARRKSRMARMLNKANAAKTGS